MRKTANRYRNRVRRWRLRALVPTQRELARLTGINRSTISALENNRRFLSSQYALLIAEALGCRLDLYQRVDVGEAGISHDTAWRPDE